MFQVFIFDILQRIKNELFFISVKEKFMVTYVKSAHDVGFFDRLHLKHNLSTFETV